MNRRAGTLALGVALVACHRGSSGSVVDAGVGVGAAAAPAAVAGDAESVQPRPTLLPARCQPTTVGFMLDDGPGVDDLEIGDAVVGAGGYAVDVVHRTQAGRVAAVALLSAGAASMQLHDLGPTLGDAPPPRVAPRGVDLVAVSYSLSKRAEARELGIYVVSAAGEVRSTGTVLESRDDSLAFDVSPTLVVWDEARSAPVPRGVIRGAEIGADGHPGPARDVSPPEADAELPRVVSSAGVTLVFWLDRKPEAASPADAAVVSEVTGEARAFSWLDVLAVDAHGVPVGPTRRLTALSGHVSAYDVTALPGRARRGPGRGAR